jgi:hypothetical protein
MHKGMKYPKEVSEKREKTKIENSRYVIVAVKPGEIHVFNTAKEAAKALGIKNSNNISASIAQKQCLVNGYVFFQWEKLIPIKENCLYGWYLLRVENRYSKERRKR